MSVHIDEVFVAFQRHQAATIRATSMFREPAKQEKMMQESLDELRKFCEEHHLPIDFSGSKTL